jgi:predicted transcriptional regulator
LGDDAKKPIATGYPADADRRLILQVIEEDPGIFVADLFGVLDLANSSFYYHLKRLREAGLIEEHKVRHGGTTRKALYLSGRGPPPGREDDPFLSEVGHRVMACLIDGAGVSSAQIMAQTGLAERTVQRHLNRLKEESLAVEKREGRNISYYGTERLKAAWKARPNQ